MSKLNKSALLKCVTNLTPISDMYDKHNKKPS